MSDDKRQDEDELELAPDTGDEELMADFKDLFPDDEETEEAEVSEGRDASEALDELDAFLDDFEQGLDSADDTAGKTSGDDEEGARQLGLDDEDLDLAVTEAGDDVAFGDDWGPTGGRDEELAEPEAIENEAVAEQLPPAQEEFMLSGEEVAAVGAAAVAAASPGAAPSVASAGQAGGPGKRVTVSIVVMLLLALGLSAAALWMGGGVAGRLDEVEQRLAALPQRAGGAGSPAADARLQAEIRQLAARVNELAVIIEGPISHLRQTNEESLAALSQRLDKLERGITVSAAAVSPAQARKLVEKATASNSESAPVTASAARSGGWVINLLSLSNEKDAQEEMTRLRKAGVRVEIQRALRDSKTWYRLRVPGFTSYEGAKAYIDTVEKQAGVKNAWVAKE